MVRVRMRFLVVAQKLRGMSRPGGFWWSVVFWAAYYFPGCPPPPSSSFCWKKGREGHVVRSSGEARPGQRPAVRVHEQTGAGDKRGAAAAASSVNGVIPGGGGAASGGAKKQHWRSYKLLVDPALKKGQHKLYRYDGQSFQPQNPGLPPVTSVHDPRASRRWTRIVEAELPLPKFKIDEYYVGPIPPKEVTFAKLNDNIKEHFLTDMCKKFGDIDAMEILHHPKTRKHMGLAKVIFTTVKAAKEAVEKLHNTSVMGNLMHVLLDNGGEMRGKLYDLLLSGKFTPQTLPVEKLTEEGPADTCQPCDPRRRTLSENGCYQSAASASLASADTPYSTDTAYSSGLRDTPASSSVLPPTPLSSATQHGTPGSVDSLSYGSMHSAGTPVSLEPPQTPTASCSSSSSAAPLHEAAYLPTTAKEGGRRTATGATQRFFPAEGYAGQGLEHKSFAAPPETTAWQQPLLPSPSAFHGSAHHGRPGGFPNHPPPPLPPPPTTTTYAGYPGSSATTPAVPAAAAVTATAAPPTSAPWRGAYGEPERPKSPPGEGPPRHGEGSDGSFVTAKASVAADSPSLSRESGVKVRSDGGLRL
ncbi:histone-lysine N-methyltransferase SETD1B-A-like [Lethenteron reissneri]|uniref:histone-lysine N-methyltransferase SETD1B-A-like n=1 Tax=Lethenteron reissneri TaxID=7753 RepID=UPI002AB6C3C4|nr:histone-lysine N-methyltransferase SETD1B-A-like [Lethenteron reissneri]